MEIKIGNDLYTVLCHPNLMEEIDASVLAYSVGVALDSPSIIVSQYVVYEVEFVFYESMAATPNECEGVLSVGTAGVKYVRYKLEFPISVRDCPHLVESQRTGALHSQRIGDYQQSVKKLTMGLYYDGEWVLDLASSIKNVS